MKIGVIGASGLVGDSLTRRLTEVSGYEVAPFIRSSGNAWSLLARGMQPLQLDLLDSDSVTAAISDCTHVVNCSRGSDDVMLGGLENLLDACSRGGVKKFVHLSSVMVYGDPPAGNSTSEKGDTNPAKGTYGRTKLQQDEMVQKAARDGLPAVILCPPNIIGPNSYFLDQVLQSIDSGRFRLAESGNTVCNTVDVSNLGAAIECALLSEESSGKRYFVTDQEDTSWSDIVDGLAPLLLSSGEIPEISKTELLELNSTGDVEKISIWRAIKHLASSDIREALRKDPLWRKFDYGLRAIVAKLGTKTEDRLRLAIEGPIKIERKRVDDDAIDLELCMQQLRGVRHASELATKELDFRPQYSVADSMRAYRRCYKALRGVDTDGWSLARRLFVRP